MTSGDLRQLGILSEAEVPLDVAHGTARRVPEVVKGGRIDLLTEHIADGCIWNHVGVQEGQPQGQQSTREPRNQSETHGLGQTSEGSLSLLKTTGHLGTSLYDRVLGCQRLRHQPGDYCSQVYCT